jgi:glycine cleavage system H protein
MTDPRELHYLIDHQVWARRDDDGLFTVGITRLGVQLAGEIYMCRPKAVGSEVEQGRSIAVVELAKSIVSVKSPLHGRVVAVNPVLEAHPEVVFKDPYGAGWLARVAATNFAADAPTLVTGDAVAPAMAHHAWLSRQQEQGT